MKRMSRREFLSLSLKAAACCAAAYGSLGSRLVFAQSPEGSGKILVLINFFGGIDGLNWIVPYGNSVYYDRRPTIGIPAHTVLPLDGQMGLNPNWNLLHKTVVSDRQFAVIQQVGYPNGTRSHFESQDVWSLGRRNPLRNDDRGWIGRLADLYFDSNYDVVGMGVSPRFDFEVRRPEVRPLVVNSLQNLDFHKDWRSNKDNDFRREIAEQNAFSRPDQTGLQGKVQQSLRALHASTEQLRQINADYRSSIHYPTTPLGNALREIAKIIQSNIGTQVYYTGINGWDTHANELQAMNANLANSAEAIDAFIRDLKMMGKWDKVCLGLFSEFGRKCFENGSFGTDHGHGNSMVLMGGQVRGGIYGPTPSAEDLRRDDLDYYIDFRSVFKTIVRSHFGLDPNPIFDEPIPIAEPSLPLFS
jgi:uncharacterized protein (DUF1501 family)